MTWMEYINWRGFCVSRRGCSGHGTAYCYSGSQAIPGYAEPEELRSFRQYFCRGPQGPLFLFTVHLMLGLYKGGAICARKY